MTPSIYCPICYKYITQVLEQNLQIESYRQFCKAYINILKANVYKHQYELCIIISLVFKDLHEDYYDDKFT